MAETSNIFSSLGRVDAFRTGDENEFSFRGLKAWMKAEKKTIDASLRAIVPDEYLASSEAEDLSEISVKLIARLEEIGCGELASPRVESLATQNQAIVAGLDEDDDDYFGDDDEPDEIAQPAEHNSQSEDTSESPDAARQAENLLDRLFDTATLPSYAFPTNVVSMTVFDRNRSTSYRSVIKYAPQRGLDQVFPAMHLDARSSLMAIDTIRLPSTVLCEVSFVGHGSVASYTSSASDVVTRQSSRLEVNTVNRSFSTVRLARIEQALVRASTGLSRLALLILLI